MTEINMTRTHELRVNTFTVDTLIALFAYSFEFALNRGQNAT